MTLARGVRKVFESVARKFPCGCNTSTVSKMAPMTMMARIVKEKDVIKFQVPETKVMKDAPRASHIALTREQTSDVIEVEEVEEAVMEFQKLSTDLVSVQDQHLDVIEVLDAEEAVSMMNYSGQTSEIQVREEMPLDLQTETRKWQKITTAPENVIHL